MIDTFFHAGLYIFLCLCISVFTIPSTSRDGGTFFHVGGGGG